MIQWSPLLDSAVPTAAMCFLCMFGLVGCGAEKVPDVFRPRNDHEAYVHGLKQAGLLETALGKDWTRVSSQCLDQAFPVELPYQEAFYFPAQEPRANAYSFAAKRGHKIQINIETVNSGSLKLFIDLFRIDFTRDSGLVHVASADRNTNLLGFEPREDAGYVLRMQPELLRGGRFKLSIKVVPSLEFPVVKGNNRDIGSFFGDPRDGGRRKHHGIDIFARRHTPIIAPTDGYIRYVGERGRGGRVVWMRDHHRDMTLYFAHLQDIIAREETWVKAGDTLGTVGNTGNARTTPPHLHFGIYRNGPIDPYHFVALVKSKPEKIRADVDLVGHQVRTKRSALMTAVDHSIEPVNISLDRFQVMEIEAVYASHYRVRLPNGRKGQIHRRDIELISQPLSHAHLPDKLVLIDQPGADYAIIENLDKTEEVSVLGKDTSHWYVRTSSGQSGWIEAAP